MSTFRKKSTTSTEGSSSSSTTGSSSSESSSCSDSGSSSSDSESSSTVDEKGENATKVVDGSNAKSQASSRRKSSEFKTTVKAESDKHTAAATVGTSVKSRLTNGTAAPRHQRPSLATSEEDQQAAKKALRNGSTMPPPARKKPTGSSSLPQVPKSHSISSSSNAIKVPQTPSTSKAHSSQISKVIAAKAPMVKSDTSNTVIENGEDTSHKLTSMLPPPVVDSVKEEVPYLNNKAERKTHPKLQPPAPPPLQSSLTTAVGNDKAKNPRATKSQPKRNASSKTSRAKSSDDSDTESGTMSGDDTTTSSESEATDSTNSYASQPTKAVKGKKAPPANKLPRFDSNEINNDNKACPRKLTRSLSTRRSKQQVKHTGGSGSDTDALAELDGEKRSISKSPAKKPTSNKCKVKKEMNHVQLVQPTPRCLTPPVYIEKKCPIEGCDSSGHLSGNLDKHFLPEACPIYHNMSASECKERANDRKLRHEIRQNQNMNNVPAPASAPASAVANTSIPLPASIPAPLQIQNTESAANRIPTPEEKEVLNKIRDSRARFRPIANSINADKVKIEKDCADEDREPNLVGLVPEYDLQLFREAQAIASEKIEQELKELPVGKGIKYITMGKYKMKVWYQSPYPDDAARLPQMYICEYCLRYQKSETGIKRHAQKCVWRHPPGDEIYRKGKLQVWQVDGKRQKQYCQHLCLLAKFFLDHKTLYYDVEPFLFYIMTLADIDGCHTVGYFSKEKNSFYNVSCILTLPPYQRKGYGRLLIDFSYLLTRVEGKIGSPEKPLSDLGLISYRSYWKDVLLDYLCNRSGNTLSIKDVSQEMAIYSYDIVSTLQALGMMKYWKGKHIVLKKQDVLDEYAERVKRRGNFPKIDDTCLRWSPFVSTQTNNVP